MTVKDYLRQYERAVRKVERLETEYLKEKNLIDALNDSLGGDGTPHSSAISNSTEQKALRLSDKLLELEDAKIQAIEVRQEIFDTIEAVPDMMGEVLYKRYIELKRWWQIADELNYSERQTQRIHQDALLYLKDVIECHN